MYPISHIMTLQPIFFDPSHYYLWTRVVLNSNVTFSEPEEWNKLRLVFKKTSSNLIWFQHWGLSEYLNWELCQFLLLSWNLTSDLLNALNSFTSKLLKALKGSGCPQNSKAERESEFWLDRILMGIHEEFPWLKNRGKTIPENLLVFQKKGYGLPCSKHGGYFVPIPWRALCGQEIFSMRIEVFSIQIEIFFRPP